MTPVAIPSDGGTCFGSYHPAPGPAVLVCPMFGYESLSTYRLWRTLAEQLADQGRAVLRFDLPGTGNAGEPATADRVAAWRAAVDAAATWLRDRHGDVSLLGCRFGALLALDAVGRGTPCDTLVLMDPPADGAAMVRQLRARARLKAAGGEGENSIEAYGMTLDDGSLATLRAMPVRGGLPARVLLIGDPAEPAWLARFQEAAVPIEPSPFDEREAFVMRNSFQVEPPSAAFARVLAAFALRDRAVTPPPVTPSGIEGPAWREEPVWFGPGLFGILCLPPSPKGPAVLIPSVGNLPASGPGREGTELARRLAAAGHPSLRFDCACTGESAGTLPEAARGDPAVETYLPHQVAALAPALDVLGARGFDRAVVIGHCSGAYLGWHAAATDARIVGVFAINLLLLHALTDATAAAAVRPSGVPAATGATPAPVRPSLPGRAKQAIQRWMPQPVWDALRAMTPEEVGVRRHLRALLRRGCRVAFVFGDQEDEQYRYHRAFGRRPRLPQGAVELVVQGADHMFATAKYQAQLIDLAVAFVTQQDTNRNEGTIQS